MDYGVLPKFDIRIEINQKREWEMNSYRMPSFASRDAVTTMSTTDKDKILEFLNNIKDENI